MINLQNCKSQTPVESYITSSVVRGAPVTPTPAATAASRRAGRPWSCTGDTHTHISATAALLATAPLPRGTKHPGESQTPQPARPRQQPPAPTARIPVSAHPHPSASPPLCSSTTTTHQPSQFHFQSDFCSFAQKHYLKLLHVLLKF